MCCAGANVRCVGELMCEHKNSSNWNMKDIF